MPTSLKVMTWNVENLFRPPGGAAAADVDRYHRKLALLADTITDLSPDVVGLQELGGEDGLQDLQDALGSSYPRRRFSGFPDRRGIGVGFLSKLALDDGEDIVQLPPGPALDVNDLDGAGNLVPIDRMGRGALRIRVTKDGFTADLVTAHLKSKLLSFSRPGGRTSFAPRDEGERAQVAGIALRRRTAEAVTLRLRANELLADGGRVPLIVMGDLNDVPEAATAQILPGPPGSELGTSGFDRPDAGDRMRLFNLAPAIVEERRFSRVHRGRGELLDQILASEEFFPQEAGRRRMPVEVDSHVEFAGGLPSISEEPAARADELAPDHAPVTATFDI